MSVHFICVSQRQTGETSALENLCNNMSLWIQRATEGEYNIVVKKRTCVLVPKLFLKSTISAKNFCQTCHMNVKLICVNKCVIIFEQFLPSPNLWTTVHTVRHNYIYAILIISPCCVGEKTLWNVMWLTNKKQLWPKFVLTLFL